MERVAVLSHVKASSIPPSLHSSGVRRIAWQGGKISSNKQEALQKFLQRKLKAGDHMSAQQVKAALKKEGNETKIGTHKSHKVSGGRTVLKTGRVLGPKVGTTTKQMKKAGKLQDARRPKAVGKTQKKAEVETASISLEDKLGLSLDALMGGQNKTKRGNAKRR